MISEGGGGGGRQTQEDRKSQLRPTVLLRYFCQARAPEYLGREFGYFTLLDSLHILFMIRPQTAFSEKSPCRCSLTGSSNSSLQQSRQGGGAHYRVMRPTHLFPQIHHPTYATSVLPLAAPVKGLLVLLLLRPLCGRVITG